MADEALAGSGHENMIKKVNKAPFTQELLVRQS